MEVDTLHFKLKSKTSTNDWYTVCTLRRICGIHSSRVPIPVLCSEPEKRHEHNNTAEYTYLKFIPNFDPLKNHSSDA